MSAIRTLSLLALLVSSPASHGDPRGYLGSKAGKVAIWTTDGKAKIWSQGILLLWLESGDRGRVVLCVTPEGPYGDQMLPIAQKLISAAEAKKLGEEFTACRDAALIEAGPPPANSQPKTWMFVQSVTRTTYGADLPTARSIPLDRAPKALERLRKFISDCAKK